MDVLGHQRFAAVGHDTGYIVCYALAADHPERVDRVALAEIPGPPEPSHSPPLFLPASVNNRIWHIAFNRVDDPLTETLVRGHEDVFFGYEFAIQGGARGLPDAVQRYYIDLFSDPEVLRGGFGLYRAWDATLAQNTERAQRRLPMPVLGIGGEQSWGPRAGDAMRPLADDVRTAVIPGAGHWVAEQAPDELVAELSGFLAPYRDREMEAGSSRAHAFTG